MPESDSHDAHIAASNQGLTPEEVVRQTSRPRDEGHWRLWFAQLYDAVSEAEKIDTNAGDSAVSVVLWSFGERRDAVKP